MCIFICLTSYSVEFTRLILLLSISLLRRWLDQIIWQCWPKFFKTRATFSSDRIYEVYVRWKDLKKVINPMDLLLLSLVLLLITFSSLLMFAAHLAPSFFEKVQIGRSGGPEFWVIRKVRDPHDLIFKTQDLWFQPLIEVLSLHCPPILNFPCAGIPESPKMYQPRQNHHIPQMNKNSSYVKKI